MQGNFLLPMPAAFLDFTDYLIYWTKISFESFSFVTRQDFSFLAFHVLLNLLFHILLFPSQTTTTIVQVP